MTPMEELEFPVFAKINLILEVLGRRPDGYHPIRSVLQTITLEERLRLVPAEAFSFHCNIPQLENPQNLVVRAWRAVEALRPLPPMAVTLEKAIPWQSGLGGGSADAAALIRGLCRLLGWHPGRETLLRLGLSLGADLPAALTGGAVVAEGIGEQITPLPDGPSLPLAILKPPVSFSTAQMYQRIDRCPPAPQGDLPAMTAALQAGDAAGAARLLCNHFEQAASPQEPIRLAKAALLAQGALGAGMTGSGSAVFGIFAREEEAAAAARSLAQAGWQAWACRTLPRGEQEAREEAALHFSQR